MKQKGFRLYNVLVTMILAAFGALLVFLSIALVPRVTNLLQTNAIDRTKETVLQGAKGLDIFVDNLLSALNHSATLLPRDMGGSDDTWQAQLLFMDESRGDISGIALFKDDGTLLYSTVGALTQSAQSVRESAFFEQATQRQGTVAYFSLPHVQNLFGEQRKTVVTVARAVEFMENGAYVTGVLSMDVDYNALLALIKRITLSESGYVYLLDEYDNLVCHPFEQEIYSQLISENLSEIKKQPLGVMHDTHGGKERVLIAASIAVTRWRMVGVAYIDEITTLESAFIRIISVVMLSAALLSFVFATLAAHFITKPITLLESTMKKVIKGDLNVTLSEEGFLEIRSVASVFNHMLLRIRKLMDQIVVEQETKRLHELNALQAQINPHFLYNTLDSIIWMEERGRGKEAIPMVSALARLFRIAISKGKAMILVSEELEHVRNYLIIQKMRFKDTFSYTFSATEEALSETTVKLIVQPIVENCLNHAIDASRQDELHIAISAYVDECNLYFTIRDDGMGIDGLKVKTLLTTSTGTSGIGLKNVHERIALTHGSVYGLTVQSVEDEYTLVTVTQPRRPQPKKEARS